MTRKPFFNLAFALIASAASLATAGMTELHCWSWSKRSANGKYLFVYLFPQSLEEQAAAIRELAIERDGLPFDEQIAEVQLLHDTYEQTGMYLNDGSTTPLWTTNEWVDGGEISPDGTKIVSFYTTGCIVVASIYEANTPVRRIGGREAYGTTAALLNCLAGEYPPCVDAHSLDVNWDHLQLNFENGSTATVRLDDFAIVQSNTLRYAFFSLFTTARGIAVFIVLSTMACGLLWALVRLLMGGRWIKLRN